MMKKILVAVLFAMLIFSVAPVLAVKPSGNLASAEKVAWNVSAEVMRVPPYGSQDIPGSDDASKLIVNQPNGNVEVVITGVMNGLNPNTMYTVYLSKGYTPYVYTGWNIKGTYVLRLEYGANYDHDIIIDVQSDGALSGTGGYPSGGSPYNYPYHEDITGTIDVMTGAITIHSVYENGYWYEATGTIASDGTMSGTWTASNVGTPSVWYSIAGQATRTHTGDMGWSGLFTNTIQPFTFTTNEYGSASWHLNLRDSDFNGPSTYTLSVWINAGLTMLISDNFTVEVD